VSDVYFFEALHDRKPAPPPTAACAQRFIECLSGAARPCVSALAAGEKLEINAEGIAGPPLLCSGRLCHMAAFDDQE
jgi:hypothetical protein